MLLLCCPLNPGVFVYIQPSIRAGFTFLQQDYGGFLALTMLKSTEKLIRCAAVQAPVTDWSMYGEQRQLYFFNPHCRDMEICITSAAAAAPPTSLFYMLYCLGNVTLIILRFYFRDSRRIEFFGLKSFHHFWESQASI